MKDAEDPLWTVMAESGPFHAKGFLPLYCKRLEETGRAWAIPELKKRHPEESDYPGPRLRNRRNG